MDTTSFWTNSGDLPRFPPPESDVEVDTIVVGAGITGVTTAWLLKKSGRRVALIDRGRCGHADTGHTTAHLTPATDLRLHKIVSHFGPDAARTVWDAGTTAIERIERTVREEGILCDFTRVPGYLHALPGADQDALNDLRKEWETTQDLKIHAEWMDEVPYVKAPGVRFPHQARFHPLRYLQALLERVPGDGSHVFEETQVDEITDDPLTVSVGKHKIHGRRLVLATHTPLQGTSGTVRALLFQTKLALYTSYVVSGRLPEGVVPDALFWDTLDPYNYLRLHQDGKGWRAVYGGQDHKTGQDDDTESAFARLEESCRRLIPRIALDHRWSGQVIETNDGLPFIGELGSSQFVATGFSGNGMTFGTIAAMMAVDADFGHENRWSTLFDPNRTTFRGGIWHYLQENKDYPYHLVRDWLFKGGRESLATIRPGSGKVLLVKGKKVAASRNAEGALTLCSAVCPHLGCIVDWNTAEQTWDCPCHGSRFTPEGAVMSGPAEDALRPIPSQEPS